MALRMFKTRHADYFLALEWHSEAEGAAGLSEHIEELDALILESATPHSELDGWRIYRCRPGEDGYSQASVLQTVASRKPSLPIYVVDYPHRTTAIDFIPLPTFILAGLLLFVYGVWHLVGRGQTNYLVSAAEILVGTVFGLQGLRLEKVAKRRRGGHMTTAIQAFETCILPTPRDGFRDAIAAIKIDHVAKTLISGRPKIGIMYGAAHAGLIPKLKCKTLRTATAFLYRLVGHFGASTQALNTVSEFRLVGGELRLCRSFSSKLF